MKILIGGGFDLLHTGHILKIKSAKMLGDYLVVNITPDSRIKRTKGENRPILSQRERKALINSLKGVDEVVCVEERGELERDEYEIEYIKKVKPDIFSTSQRTQKLERFCNKNNIELLIWEDFKGLDGVHTTDIINKIRRW